MFWMIDPTGCCECKGMRQVKLCFYLDKQDSHYDRHLVNVPDIPAAGYPGKKKGNGQPDDEADWMAWRDSLPKKQRVNPFHNHFIFVPLDATDDDIAAEAEKLMPKFYRQWQRGEKLGVKRGRN